MILGDFLLLISLLVHLSSDTSACGFSHPNDEWTDLYKKLWSGVFVIDHGFYNLNHLSMLKLDISVFLLNVFFNENLHVVDVVVQISGWMPQ